MFRLATRVDSRPRPAVGGKGDFTRARLDLTTDGQLTVTRPPRDVDPGFVSGAQIDLNVMYIYNIYDIVDAMVHLAEYTITNQE